jgi:serine-aspartate repeat-containing protein C/D/E
MRSARFGFAACAFFLCFVAGLGQVSRQQVNTPSGVRPPSSPLGREVLWRAASDDLAAAVPVFGSIASVASGTPAAPQPIFGRRQDVFLAGGPVSAPCRFAEYLPDGKYYFQVTDPSGNQLLSTDTVSERSVTVKAGVIASYDGATHAADGRTACGSLAVNLMPFADAGSQKAAYVVWLTPAADFDGSVTAVDSICGAGCFHGFHPELSRTFAFRVEDKKSCEPTFCISGVKFLDANGNGARDSSEAGLPGVEIHVVNESGVVLSGLTGPDGSFRICGITDSGAFKVSESVPFGYTQTGPGDRDVSRHVFARSGAYIIEVCQEDIAGLDFGNKLIPNAIGGLKYEDLNANGQRDAGEPGLSGVTIILRPADGSSQRTATTDASGNFLFTDVTPGAYVLTETVPAGFSQTQPASDGIPVTLVSGGSSIDNLFGNFHGILTGTISGLKFLDANGNGVMNAGEGGLAGVTITLAGGGLTKTAVTGSDGSFSFTGIPFGTYTLSETVPSGFQQTTPPSPGTLPATLDFGHQTVTGLLFGNQALAASIAGTKFNDLNGNGVRDAGEPGLAGVTIQLRDPAGQIKTATTDASGAFSFTGLTSFAGAYTLSEVVPAGFVQTAPAAPGTFSIPLTPGQNATGFLFGNRAQAALAGSISGTKFNDLNGNGSRGAEEPGLAGVTIQLQPPSGPTLTATTDASGAFSFPGLAAGTYVLSEVVPAGFVQTAPPAPGTISVTLTAGQAATGFLFGNQAVAEGAGSISGLKFLDINTNGIRDAIDQPLEGIVLVLTDSNGVVRQTTSAADGTFSFVNLPPGNYVLSEIVPPNFRQTFPGTPDHPETYTITLAPGQNATGFLFLNKC